MEEKVIMAALAGLLHDIGKVEQRARPDPWKPPEGFPLEGQPVHAKWSEYFIAGNLPPAYRPAALQGVYHHQPDKSPAQDTFLSRLVALADKLSAGERADEPQVEKGSRPPQQMVSIFDRVGPYREDARLSHHYLPLGELSLSRDAVFPTAVLQADGARVDYEKIRDRLREAAGVDIRDPETYLENLLAALQRYTWAVPSAYYHSLPDVSLYDHARMTAALAVCMRDFPAERLDGLLAAVRAAFASPQEQGGQPLLDEPAALLVGGDISGIQGFLYTLSSKGAAKTLRGRSFYLQLLTEAVLRFTLREIGLPSTNVIYSGGGHFYFLAPLSAADKLPQIQKQVTRILLKHHGPALYLAIGWAEVPASGFRLGNFPEYWSQMHAALARAKQHRYQELGEELYLLVFEPAEHGGNQENTCSVCGEEKDQTEPLDGTGDSEAGDRICSLCQSFDTSIGRRLPDAAFACLSFGSPISRQPGGALDVLAEFGMGVQFYDRGRKLLPDGARHPEAARGLVWALGDVSTWPDTGVLPVARLQRYTVNRVPHETFDELQKKSTGFQRLGVLRMDVDNLGDLFKYGFGKPGKSIATVARLSSLSFQMSLFFEGWVKHICEEVSADIYAVYSGGDDLFLIAPWDIVPGLALRIAADFSSYTSANPDLHISGGMAFIHGKYPVYQAARDALDALSAAKDRPGKRSFTFLGHAWEWREFESLKDRYLRLVKIDRDMGGARSLLQFLQKLSAMEAGKATEMGRPVYGPWIWLGEYQFKRMAENAGDRQDLADALEEIHQELTPFYHDLRPWGTAARWAQLFLRKPKEEAGDTQD